jgi:hypothetical protein
MNNEAYDSDNVLPSSAELCFPILPPRAIYSETILSTTPIKA